MVTRVVMLRKEAQKVVLLLVSATLAGRRGHKVVQVGWRRTHPLAPVQPKSVHVRQLKSWLMSSKRSSYQCHHLELGSEQRLHVKLVDVGESVGALHHHLKDQVEGNFKKF